jgi:hypothetical protein
MELRTRDILVKKETKGAESLNQKRMIRRIFVLEISLKDP